MPSAGMHVYHSFGNTLVFQNTITIHMELEHLRSYLAQGEIYTSQKMDAYLVQVIDQLQGVGQLCERCWQRILQTTIRRFFGRY